MNYYNSNNSSCVILKIDFFLKGAEIDVPLRFRVQITLGDSMVRGILQFTTCIAFRYVRHRYKNRDIRWRELIRIHFLYRFFFVIKSNVWPEQQWSRGRFIYYGLVTTSSSSITGGSKNFSTKRHFHDAKSIQTFHQLQRRIKRRAVSTKGRDIINAGWWPTLTRHSSLKNNNSNILAPARRMCTDYPGLSTKGTRRVRQCSPRAA